MADFGSCMARSGRIPRNAAMERIASLLPSTTEIVCALGLRAQLVGRSHECDFPPEVAALPALTESKLDPRAASRAIDDRVKQLVREGLSIYRVDAERLRALAPERGADAGAVRRVRREPQGRRGGARATGPAAGPRVVSLAPHDARRRVGRSRHGGDGARRPRARGSARAASSPAASPTCRSGRCASGRGRASPRSSGPSR